MFRKPVTSSIIKTLGYDPEGQIMEIEFSDGDVVQYLEVPPKVHADFIAAPSLGLVWRSEIAHRYKSRVVK